jgi:hypothetical protein
MKNSTNGFSDIMKENLYSKVFYLYLFILFIFIFRNDFAMPIEAIPDEVGQLKNIYAMINAKSLALQYKTQFAIWIHYPYIPPTLAYWGSVYLFGDFASLNEFKIHVLQNYQDVLPLLRGFTALVFLIGLILVRKAIESMVNKEQSYLFVIFVSFNLLIVINNHYSKFWMFDFGVMLMAFYFYWKYQITNKLSMALWAYFLFLFGTLSNPSIVMSGLFFVYIHYHYHKSLNKRLFKDIAIFLGVLAVMMIVQNSLGVHGHAKMIVNDPMRFLQPELSLAYDLVFTQFDYDPIITALFFISIVGFFFGNKRILVLVIPYAINLLLIASMHFETRYVLLMIINTAFVATYGAYYLYTNKRVLFNILAAIYLLLNLFYIFTWLSLAGTKDTRVEAKEWLEKNITQKEFLVYNTLGFNYVANTKEAIDVLKDIAPNSITSREKMHIKYNLPDGKNALIVWKIPLGGYTITDTVNQLVQRGYRPILVNERFGHQYGMNKYYQKGIGSIKELEKNFELVPIKEFYPYKDSVKDIEMAGDVLYNFNYVFTTLTSLKQSGPKLTIYEIKAK